MDRWIGGWTETCVTGLGDYPTVNSSHGYTPSSLSGGKNSFGKSDETERRAVSPQLVVIAVKYLCSLPLVPHNLEKQVSSGGFKTQGIKQARQVEGSAA